MIATLLQAIQPTLLSKPTVTMPVPAISSSFVRAGASPKRSKGVCLNRSLLGSVSDWKLLVDIKHKPYLFSQRQGRLDTLMCSNSLRVVIFGELTCPAEEGIAEASVYKQPRYADTADVLRGLKHPWTVHVLTLEVGARARSTYTFLRKIAFTATAAMTTCRQVSKVVARCCCAIYLRHSEKDWNSSRVLLVPRSCKEPTYEVDASLR